MSYAKNLFEGVPSKKVNKSRFNLSHEWKNNVNLGKIIPVLCEPTLPNDEWQFDKSEFMFRFAPLYYPLMHMCNLFCNFFYVPNRILWRETTHTPQNGWKAFISLTDIDGVTEDHPVVTVDNQLNLTTPSENDTVLGFMGFPYYHEAVGYDDVIDNINAFPLSAYLAIWDEYYRNPQLEEGKWFNLEPGDNTANFLLAFDELSGGRYRVFSSKWEKDYFTSALPQPQVGDAILVPTAGMDPETGLYFPQEITELDGGDPTAQGLIIEPTDKVLAGADSTKMILHGSATIRDLRWAEALQTFKERVLKVGQRYVDFLKGLWGNNISPGEAQVPVWFGYYRGKIQISDVTSTAATETGETSNALGVYSGKADLYEVSDNFNVFCSEHGWIIALMELKPNTSYGQGLPRWFRYQLPTDYPLDIFASIGDQEIRKEEILLWTRTGESAKNNETFGYIPRFSEYRYRNGIHGGNLMTPFGLSQHLGRWWNPPGITDYSALMEIGPDFINMRPDLVLFQTLGGLRESDVFTILPDQITTASAENTIFCHILHSVFVNRELPMFSTPKLG